MLCSTRIERRQPRVIPEDTGTKSLDRLENLLRVVMLPLQTNKQINKKQFLSLDKNKANLTNFFSKKLRSKAPKDIEIVIFGGFKEELQVRSSKGTTHLNLLRSIHEAVTRPVLHTLHSQLKKAVLLSNKTDVLLSGFSRPMRTI